MACGNDESLGLTFYPGGNNTVTSTVRADLKWQGYAGVMHGGMISTLLDAAMTHCLFQQGVEAVTAALNVRFLEPVSCSDVLEIKAGFSERRRHVYFLNAEISSSGRILARAEARFIRRNKRNGPCR